LIVLGVGLNPTDALVGSQVVLSFGIPFALVPLVLLGRRRDLMGSLTNPPWLTAVVSVLSAMIIALNVFLVEQVFIGG
jgi:manganese transport protein